MLDCARPSGGALLTQYVVVAAVLGVIVGFVLALAVFGPGRQRELEELRQRERAEADRVVARLGRQIQDQEGRTKELLDVLQTLPDLVRQMFAAKGKRGAHAAVIKLADHIFDPVQCALFVARPEGKLALTQAKGVPESVPRNFEIDVGTGRVGHVALKQMAMDEADFANATATEKRQIEAGRNELRWDVVAPMLRTREREDGLSLVGVVAIGGARRRHGDEKRLLKMVADLAGLAFEYVERLGDVQNAADIDGLTRVYNKRFLHKKLGDEIHRKENEHGTLSLLILDIDHFKNYNDTNGHLAGDEVLKTIGQLLRRSVREDDVVARYGGEEFVILYPGAAKERAYQLAQNLRHSVETYPFAEAARQPLGCVTISGGVASFPEDAQSAVELLRAADEALYEAKGAGRNRIVGATPNYLT